MKPEYNVACFTAPVRNTWCGNVSEERCVMQRGYCVIRRGYCDGYPATKKDQQWKLELELESMKTFARHMLLGE